MSKYAPNKSNMVEVCHLEQSKNVVLLCFPNFRLWLVSMGFRVKTMVLVLR